MVLEITVENNNTDQKDQKDYFAYTVRVDNHRILTVVTDHDPTVSKWLKNVLKSPANTKTGIILVGVGAERYDYEQTLDANYDLLSLNIGCHCLLYHLPYDHKRSNSKPLQDFFADPRVVGIGIGIDRICKNFEKHHGFTIGNAVDVRDLALKGVRKLDLDIPRYDLDRVATLVLGKHTDVVRPEEKVKWFRHRWRMYNCSNELTHEKIRFSTVDPYLCFLIGFELIEAIEVPGVSTAKNNKKKNNGKIKKSR